jgi:hypothetical protein
MAETANIAAMAEKLSNELFSVFGWKRVGPTNQNWACEDTSHNLKTHPSDVVFFYDEPYAAIRTYLTCDLKSYKKGSITGASVKAAIESLSKAVACANKSSAWQKLYLHKNVTPVICGLLFIYNHDGGYDAGFPALLSEIVPSTLALPKGSKLIALGPRDVSWLDNVRYDIERCRGKGTLPPAERCQFFYPDLVRRKLIQSKPHTAATVEVLTSPWIMLESQNADGMRSGVDIYYRDSGNTQDEFIYLIDWLLHYNVVHNAVSVRIKTFNADRSAAAFFDQAKHIYVDNYGRIIGSRTDLRQRTSALEKRLTTISCQSIPQVISTFSDVELGMRP